jgi:hypothetical protein
MNTLRRINGRTDLPATSSWTFAAIAYTTLMLLWLTACGKGSSPTPASTAKAATESGTSDNGNGTGNSNGTSSANSNANNAQNAATAGQSGTGSATAGAVDPNSGIYTSAGGANGVDGSPCFAQANADYNNLSNNSNGYSQYYDYLFQDRPWYLQYVGQGWAELDMVTAAHQIFLNMQNALTPNSALVTTCTAYTPSCGTIASAYYAKMASDWHYTVLAAQDGDVGPVQAATWGLSLVAADHCAALVACESGQ